MEKLCSLVVKILVKFHFSFAFKEGPKADLIKHVSKALMADTVRDSTEDMTVFSGKE